MASRRILIVDDLEDTVMSFAYLLTQMGHLVEYTTHPEAALVIARRFGPEFAFVDIGMPRIDGWKLAGQLRSGSRQVRLIAVTGYNSETDRARSAAAGFEAHMAKPVDIARVEELLAR